MKSLNKSFLSICGGILAAGILGGGMVSAEESDKGIVSKAEEASPLYVPVGNGGHTWTFVKTEYTTTGYIKVYSDKDSYWYYVKEVYYTNSSNYVKTVYSKFAI
ncbi:hypothetical protein [Bacillus sp. AK031]